MLHYFYLSCSNSSISFWSSLIFAVIPPLAFASVLLALIEDIAELIELLFACFTFVNSLLISYFSLSFCRISCFNSIKSLRCLDNVSIFSLAASIRLSLIVLLSFIALLICFTLAIPSGLANLCFILSISLIFFLSLFSISIAHFWSFSCSSFHSFL